MHIDVRTDRIKRGRGIGEGGSVIRGRGMGEGGSVIRGKVDWREKRGSEESVGKVGFFITK